MESELNNPLKEQASQSQSSVNFWEICGQKTKTEIIDLLIDRLGEPKNELDNGCLDAIARKVIYFTSEEKDTRGQAVSSLIGQVVEMSQTKFKSGRRMGKIYYLVKLENKTILRAAKEDLPAEKWTQIEQLAILDQKLLFKYRKWIINKDIVDFEPVESEQVSNPQP